MKLCLLVRLQLSECLDSEINKLLVVLRLAFFDRPDLFFKEVYTCLQLGFSFVKFSFGIFEQVLQVLAMVLPVKYFESPAHLIAGREEAASQRRSLGLITELVCM